MNAHIKRIIRKIFSPIRRIGLKNRSFSIISNNCWGGVVYDIFGLEYQSPTIGCYFFSKDYILFLNNLRQYLASDLIFVPFKQSKYYSVLSLKMKDCVIGRIGSIEIIFLHYSSFQEAKEKWTRRCKRVNFDNLLVKYSDQNLFQAADYLEFEKTNFRNKLFITGNRNYKENDCVYLPKFRKIGYAVDDIKPSLKKIKIKQVLNNL
jgi:uncharacterized protein (DUF1919 family)